jgi:hypothetical protein
MRTWYDYPQEVAQSAKTTPNEMEVTSSNHPPLFMRTCQKKKELYDY